METEPNHIADSSPLKRGAALRVLLADRLAGDLASFAKKGWAILNPTRPLIWSWHYDYLCEMLTLAKQRRLLRLIINIPPRTLKSTSFGQVSGGEKLTDSHPSPDFALGEIQFRNGVRGLVEIGNLAQDVPEVEYFWHKVRIGAQGTEGFAEALIGGGWRAMTRDSGRPISGPGCWNARLDQPPYIRDIALWLDDESRIHPCNGESAFKGFEILMAVCRSALERRRVSLPLERGEPEIQRLSGILPGTHCSGA